MVGSIHTVRMLWKENPGLEHLLSSRGWRPWKVHDRRWATGPTPPMNLSSASHYRGGHGSVGSHTLGLDWEANDFFHFLPGLGNRAPRVTG